MTEEGKPKGRIVLSRVDFDLIEKDNTDIVKEYVHVPEWAPPGVDPDTVYVCITTISGTERDRFESSNFTLKGKERVPNLSNIRAKLVAACLIDENTGERLYKENEIARLGKRSAKALDRLFDACRALNGMTPESLEEKVEELKNDQSAFSGSA